MRSVADNNFSAERHAMRDALLSHGPCPPSFSGIWSDFRTLSARRGGTGFGAAPIALADVEAYSRLMRVDITPSDTEILMTLDAMYLGYMTGAIPTSAPTEH